MTTDSGTITTVIYRAALKTPVTGEVTFRRSIGLVSDKLEIEGPAAEQFRGRKLLVKKIRNGLNRRYDGRSSTSPPVQLADIMAMRSTCA
jgi:hypothetical protein